MPAYAGTDVELPVVVELCAGAGGQALGLERAGFTHAALVEVDQHACATLRANRPSWKVLEADLNLVLKEGELEEFAGACLLSAGVPCPPFSVAGRQLGEADDRDLFPAVLEAVRQVRPKLVLIENVRGLLGKRFADYRAKILRSLGRLGYKRSHWELLDAADFGVPQNRVRSLLVVVSDELASDWVWPTPVSGERGTVGEALRDLMASGGWPFSDEWARRANCPAPTIVGGSKKHGGPDLGPTRAKQKWSTMGCSGMGIADNPPSAEMPADHVPRLTLEMVARLQGFPAEWIFCGGKTAQYRQIGNALPPPLAEQLGCSLRQLLSPPDASILTAA